LIEVRATNDTAEGHAANALAQLIIDADERVMASGEIHISVIANLQCYGQSPQDIDLALLLFDHRAKPFTDSNGRALRGCCVTIESKLHNADRVIFEGGTCIVDYHGDEHNVSSQSEQQKYSLKNYLEQHSTDIAPFINNLIWLRSLPISLLPPISSNILARDSSWQGFVDTIVSLNARPGEVKNMRDARQYFDINKILGRRLKPAGLDRRKMEVISKRVTQVDTQYLSRLGEQLLVFRGRGGTGKTIRLLQLGHQLYQEQGARVLLLTYNTALASDIHRLLTLLGIQDGVGERAIGIRTVHKLMRDWLISLKLFDSSEHDFIDEYENLKTELLSLLDGEALDSSDILQHKRDNSRNLAWDYVLIDECQDWPANERDAIFKMYGHKNCILADGVDQLVRTSKYTDWREKIPITETQIVPLRKSLRLKSSLCDVISEVATRANVPNWDLQPEPNVYGAKVIVLAGGEYDHHLHDELIANAKKDGNSIIDMLYCIPPSYVSTDSDGQRVSSLAKVFREWQCDVWDGSSDAARKSFPTSLKQHRIVQYDSCRGLEGWTVVCLSLDKFFDYKQERYDGEDIDLLSDPVALAKSYAYRWMMIPLTRAVDTLVIHIENVEHPLLKDLEAVKTKYPEIVEWRL
jgi:hypothetical protein